MRYLLLLCALFGSLWAQEGAVDLDEIITRGRAAIATEERLEALDALYFEGVLELFSDNSRAQIRLYLQKPYLQRLEVETDKFLRVTIIGEDVGWEIITDKTTQGVEPKRRLLQPEEYWKNRYSAVENLYFYHGYKRARGTVRYVERTFLEGTEVDVIEVTYNPANTHQRMISVESGQLVASRSPDGILVFERKRTAFDGLLFPTEIEYYQAGERISRVRFQKVEIDPWFDSVLFRIPAF